jgi:FKBP-type peptidyl-prolyl cis-trans isomerase 2
MNVRNQTIVSIRYLLKNNKGEILEDRMEGNPVTYCHGIGQIRPELEKKLYGLEIGDKKTFNFSQEFSGCDKNNQYSCEVIIDNIRWASEEVLRRSRVFQMSNEQCDKNCQC